VSALPVCLFGIECKKTTPPAPHRRGLGLRQSWKFPSGIYLPLTMLIFAMRACQSCKSTLGSACQSSVSRTGPLFPSARAWHCYNDHPCHNKSPRTLGTWSLVLAGTDRGLLLMPPRNLQTCKSHAAHFTFRALPPHQEVCLDVCGSPFPSPEAIQSDSPLPTPHQGSGPGL
jgi:hypothetical protein